ncbi:MAG: hypothetical protein WCI47_02715 [bacterium]
MKVVMVHRIKSFSRKRHQGSAALLLTVAVSAMLIVLFVGITSIATREIKNSISSDQSNRALYAAEAGVEDAIRRLSQDSHFEEKTCNASNVDGAGNNLGAVTVGDTNANAAWTCRTVTLSSTNIEGRLVKDDTMQINLGTAVDDQGRRVHPRYMRLEWNKDKFDSSAPLGSNQGSLSFLPPYLTADSPNDYTSWQNRAAAMEITAVWFPQSGVPLSNVLIDGVLPVRTLIASPVNSSPGGGARDFSNWNSTGTFLLDRSGDSRLKSNLTTRCLTSNLPYNCVIPQSGAGNVLPANTYDLDQMMVTEVQPGQVSAVASPANVTTPVCTIGKPFNADALYSSGTSPAPACNAVLRIRPRYASTNFSLKLYYDDPISGTKKEAKISDGYATIDVTARSSNYYRRVVAKKKLVPTVYDGIFDNALFSGKNICKDMTVYKDYRGAPDYIQQPDLSLRQNNDAGKNSCEN